MILHDLEKRNLIDPPRWIADNTCYLTITGSVSYGVSANTSDMDMCGICIPTQEIVFPHLAGEIEGFGTKKKRFHDYQRHGIKDPEHRRTYDVTVYNIVDFLSLCLTCNPNIIDCLYTPTNCILHTTEVGNLIRENRRLFLHKGAYHRFCGYAYSQLSKAGAVRSDPDIIAIRQFEDEHNISHDTTYENVVNRHKSLEGINEQVLSQYRLLFEVGISKTKRFESQKRFNTDVKFLYHLARLLDECDQILTLQDIDIQRSKEHMKAIRRGEVSEESLCEWFDIKRKEMEKLYAESKLPYGPNEDAVKRLLINCLETHYGSLEGVIVIPGAEKAALNKIANIIDDIRKCKLI